MSLQFDLNEGVNRAIKYCIEGLAVAVVAFFIMKKNHKQVNQTDIATLGLAAAGVFGILDLFAPSVGSSARNGAGLGLGFNLVNFPV